MNDCMGEKQRRICFSRSGDGGVFIFAFDFLPRMLPICILQNFSCRLWPRACICQFSRERVVTITLIENGVAGRSPCSGCFLC